MVTQRFMTLKVKIPEEDKEEDNSAARILGTEKKK